MKCYHKMTDWQWIIRFSWWTWRWYHLPWLQLRNEIIRVHWSIRIKSLELANVCFQGFFSISLMFTWRKRLLMLKHLTYRRDKQCLTSTNAAADDLVTLVDERCEKSEKFHLNFISLKFQRCVLFKFQIAFISVFLLTPFENRMDVTVGIRCRWICLKMLSRSLMFQKDLS